MPKNVLLILVIMLLGVVLSLIGPWWLPFISSFLVCAWTGKTGRAGFWLGALGMSVLWIGTAINMDSRDVTGLSTKMSALFTGSIPGLDVLPGSGPVYLILFLISFLLGGLSGYAGAMLRKVIQ